MTMRDTFQLHGNYAYSSTILLFTAKFYFQYAFLTKIDLRQTCSIHCELYPVLHIIINSLVLYTAHMHFVHFCILNAS